MAQIKKPVADDFGAIDDEDIGAIDEGDDLGAVDLPPELNPLELQKRSEEQTRAQAAQAVAIQAQQAAQAEANPANWSLDKTKKTFKENPPQNVQDEAIQNLVIDKKKSDLKAQEKSVISRFVRSIMRNAPIEQFQSLQSVFPSPVEGESREEYQKRFNDSIKESDFELSNMSGMPVLVPKKEKVKEREESIIGQGTVHQFEDLMSIGIGGGLLNAPLHTAKILAAFTGIEKLADMAGVNKKIAGVENATARDVLDIAKFGLEGIFAAGFARVKPGNWFKNKEKTKLSDEVLKEADKAIDTKAKDQPEEVKAAAKEVMRDVLDENPAVNKKFQATTFAELDKANKKRALSDHEQKAQTWAVQNPKEARQNYIDRSIEEFGSDNVLSADVGKFAIKHEPSGLKMTAARSADFHETGSAMTKAREKELLADKSTVDLPTAFTAGGSGSGKSSILRAITKKEGQSLKERFGLVYDSNMNNYGSAIGKIKRNLDDGRDVEVAYVYRDPIKAWVEGVIPRVKSQDRIVPIAEHIKTHRDSLPTVEKIAEEFKGDPRVRIDVIDNSGAHGEYKRLGSIDEVPKFDYTNIGDKLYEHTKEAYETGKLTKEQFNTALEGSPELQRRAKEVPPVDRTVSDGRTETFEGQQPPLSRLEQPATEAKVSTGANEPAPQPEGKRRKFIQTVKSSEKTVPEVAQKIESRYDPISNKETLEQAQAEVRQNYNGALEEVMSNAKPTALSNAKAIVLIDKAQNEGRIADAINIVERTAEKQTELGQAIQALSMYNRLTPEGILQYANKVVRQAREESPREKLTQFEKISKTLDQKGKDELAEKLGIPHISEIVGKELLDMSKRIQEMPEGREKQMQTAIMLKRIADLVPKGLGKKIAIVQTMAQLLNPKTFIRNLLGNVGFQLTEGLSDSVAVALDVATALRTGKRTVFLPNAKTQAQGLIQGFKEGTEEALAGVNLKEDTTKFTLPKNGVFDKGVMGALEKTLRVSLGATDRAFYQAAFNQSIRDQVLAAKAEGKAVDEPTTEMIERAHLLGLYRTFQDDNVISRQFVTLKKWLNVNKDFGLGDVILKYPKTPANILARGIEYSPFGFAKSVYELAKPLMGEEFNQEQFVRSTSRALTGTTSLIATGAILANLGIISGKRSKDPDVSAAREEVGLRAYQINVSALKRFAMSGFDPEAAALRDDDVLVSYDWMLPSSIGLALGANMVIDPKTNLVDRTLNLAEQMATASETLQEQPLVQGVKRFAQTRNVGEAFTNAFQDIPASFVPTLLNQVRQLTDNTARNTRDPNYFKEIYNKAIMRVPGASSTLPPKITARGEDKEMYQFGTNNPFNVFLNPAFVSKYKADPVSRMVLDIWEMSGETIQFPRVAQAKIKLGANTSEPIELTPEQYTEFQRYIGNKTDVLFTILADNPEFIALDDDVKAKKLQNFLTDIYTAGKIEVLGYRPNKVSADVIGIIENIANDKKQIDASEDDDIGALDEEE